MVKRLCSHNCFFILAKIFMGLAMVFYEALLAQFTPQGGALLYVRLLWQQSESVNLEGFGNTRYYEERSDVTSRHSNDAQ